MEKNDIFVAVGLGGFLFFCLLGMMLYAFSEGIGYGAKMVLDEWQKLVSLNEVQTEQPCSSSYETEKNGFYHCLKICCGGETGVCTYDCSKTFESIAKDFPTLNCAANGGVENNNGGAVEFYRIGCN